MPVISLEKVTKRFGATEVIPEISAVIDDGEFLVLLGPSGCGKSTMLRMIAGLTEISEGSVRFDDTVVNDLEPRERNVAFVFQSYALYPHLSVRENIAFPLVMDRLRPWHQLPVVNSIVRRRISRSPEVSGAVDRVARTMELTPYLDRRPAALSGGQRQRVAVARGIVRQPDVYLLDEPLSNLDAKLRGQMRAEIAALHARVGKTFVYVTHDQVEAMTMGTRIIVMDHGVVQQLGTPIEVYERPANTFVAKFIGSPAMNLIPVECRGALVEARGIRLPGALAPGDGSWLLGVRPERIRVTAQPGSGIPVVVTRVEHLGGETVIAFRLDSGDEETSAQAETVPPHDVYAARVPGTPRVALDDRLRVELDLDACSWFDPGAGARVETTQVPAGRLE